MFTDILEKKELDRLYKKYKDEGEYSAGVIIMEIIDNLFIREQETILNLAFDTTIISILKLHKQKKKLKKGYFDTINFYKWLEKNEMAEINLANLHCFKLRDSLVEEIRKIKERESAVLQLIASWSAIIIAIFALFFSVFL